MFGPLIAKDIQAAAIAAYPREMCGAVVAAKSEGFARDRGEAVFVELANVHPEPERHFDCAVACADLQAEGTLLALVHSHPDGPEAPSAHDIASQRCMDVPWGLLMCNAEAASEPYYWGDTLTPPPLVGRPFRHGPSGTDGKGDCGALIRDYYRLERGVLLPDFARGDGWWHVRGQDLYEQHYREAGFVAVDLDDAQPGDVLLIQWRVPAENPVANHGGVYTGNGYLLHHLEGRLSRPESVLGWRKHIRKVLRHAGLPGSGASASEIGDRFARV